MSSRVMQATVTAVVTVVTTAICYWAWAEWNGLGERVGELELQVEMLTHAMDVYCDE